MNEKYVKETLRRLVSDNETLLMDGLVHGGVPRQFGQIALSNLVPPQKYYYMLIYITEPREASTTQGGTNLRRPRRQAIYPVQIELSDQAMVQLGDPEPYEQMHLDFDTLGDRLVKLITDQEWIGSAPKLELLRGAGSDDRLVTKSNLSGTFLETEDTGTATLFCQINFTLYEGCVDDSGLYG